MTNLTYQVAFTGPGGGHGVTTVYAPVEITTEAHLAEIRRGIAERIGAALEHVRITSYRLIHHE